MLNMCCVIAEAECDRILMSSVAVSEWQSISFWYAFVWLAPNATIILFILHDKYKGFPCNSCGILFGISDSTSCWIRQLSPIDVNLSARAWVLSSPCLKVVPHLVAAGNEECGNAFLLFHFVVLVSYRCELACWVVCPQQEMFLFWFAFVINNASKPVSSPTMATWWPWPAVSRALNDTIVSALPSACLIWKLDEEVADIAAY